MLLGVAALFNVVPGNVGRYFLVNYCARLLFGALCVSYLVEDLRARGRPGAG